MPYRPQSSVKMRKRREIGAGREKSLCPRTPRMNVPVLGGAHESAHGVVVRAFASDSVQLSLGDDEEEVSRRCAEGGSSWSWSYEGE